jgi:hypothetical protein
LRPNGNRATAFAAHQEVEEIVNLTAIAVVDAQENAPATQPLKVEPELAGAR